MIEFPAKVTQFLASKRTVSGLKFIVLAIAVSFIYLKLDGLADFWVRSESILKASWSNRPFGIIAVLILLPFNYFFEGMKWKWLLKSLINISFWNSTRAVFSGMTLGFIAPLSIGDFAGRILFLPNHIRISSIFPLVVGRFVQFVITVFFGGLGLIYVFVKTSGIQWFDWKVIAFFLPFSLLLPVFLFFIRSKIWQLLKKWLPLNFVEKVYLGIETFTLKEFLVTIILCFGRYSIFVAQYLCILYFFGFPDLDFMILSAVFLIFLAKSTLPTLNFMSDLGVREFAALVFLEFTKMPNEVIVLGSLTLWFINILIPTIVGLIFVQQIKLVEKK